MPPSRLLDSVAKDLQIAVRRAHETGKLTPHAVQNIGHWLNLPLERMQSESLVQHVIDQRWGELEQAFWQVLPFGTAGRRGRMYPIGTATINTRTVAESVQAVANYLHRLNKGALDPRCAIAYDCRHQSREFAELSAEIMCAAGFRVWMLNSMRSTPELALTVRHHGCRCGIMITASHNPPSDNAIKVFWSTGGQLLAPHDTRVMDEIQRITAIARLPFTMAVSQQQIVYCEDEMDEVYRSTVVNHGFKGNRDIHILYSPLHGVGLTSVKPILERSGFAEVSVFAPHAAADPDFPNVPEHVANPENPGVLTAIIDEAKRIAADLVLASDPDADRIGCSTPRCMSADQWYTFTGNQIGVLIAEYVLRRRSGSGNLSPDHYLIRTIVSSDMVSPIAEAYGVKVFHDVLTGFKWIGHVIDREGSDRFVFGFEEAHGYLAGDYIRDKDAGIAALLLSQRAAESKAGGRTLVQDLDELYLRYGCFQELSVAKQMPGAGGLERMNEIMQGLRHRTPTALGGMRVHSVRDYLTGKLETQGGSTEGLDPPRSNLLLFTLEQDGFRVAIRPSGTEPKIKFYLFAYEPPENIVSLETTKQLLQDTLLQQFDDLMRCTGLAVEVA